MKCIKSIRPSKNVEIGDIKRISNVESEEKVNSGYWKYIPKTEWKKSRIKQIIEPTISDKQIKNKKERR